MPDKTELQLKAAESRISGLEKAIDSLRKTSQPDALKAAMNARFDALDKRITALEAAIVTKKDKKTMEEQQAADLAKAVAQFKKEQEEAGALNRKQHKEVTASVEKLNIQGQFTVMEARIKALEVTRR